MPPWTGHEPASIIGTQTTMTTHTTATETEHKEDFEQALGALEATVKALEEGELPLEETLKRFEAGMQLLKRCEAALKRAEQRVEILLAEEEGGKPEPFDPHG